MLNIFFYQVMIQKHNRQMSFSLYISALAVSYTLFLLNGEASIDSLTRMLFSRKRTIHVTHRSQNIENTWAFLSFKVDMTFTLNDIDLQMTLTFQLT